MTKTHLFGILTIVCIIFAGILHDIAPQSTLGLVWSISICSVLFGVCTFTCYLNGPDERA